MNDHYAFICTSWDQLSPQACAFFQSEPDYAKQKLEQCTYGYRIKWGEVFTKSIHLEGLDDQPLSVLGTDLKIVKAMLTFGRDKADDPNSTPDLFLSLIVHSPTPIEINHTSGTKMALEFRNQINAISSDQWGLGSLEHSRKKQGWKIYTLNDSAAHLETDPTPWLFAYTLMYQGKLTYWRINRQISVVEAHETVKGYREAARAQNRIRQKLIDIHRLHLSGNISNFDAWKTANQQAIEQTNLRNVAEQAASVMQMLDQHIDRVEKLRADIAQSQTNRILQIMTIVGVPVALLTLAFTISDSALIWDKTPAKNMTLKELIEYVILLGFIPFILLLGLYGFFQARRD
ncbi:hypothetical protein [Terasakiella sp. SH-1]|uniref:hypothetical protein n=1 Tax=Terasakiella sp. SH-1 TaxID=2560057 RepID=UPI0010732C11|nr:hypothetical protein [Terasakiella sp. SH-1]